MEIEQIRQRFDFLDEERRKDRTSVSNLQDKITGLEGRINAFLHQIKELESESTSVNSVLARFQEVDKEVSQMRIEFAKMIEASEKQRNEHDRENQKVWRSDIDGINTSVAELRKTTTQIAELQKGLLERIDKESELNERINNLEIRINENLREDETSRRLIKSIDETRNQDSKRISDLSAELAGLRKRADEQRAKVELSGEQIRKMELRISELQTNENERRQSMNTFVEKQNLSELDREKNWKDWELKFDSMLQQSNNLDVQLRDITETQRDLNKVKGTFDEINQRFDRRINELTEMQRLGEERFRQEWVTFKSDDQKRWTNYILAQEEQQREIKRLQEKNQERLLLVEDLEAELRDQVRQIDDQYKKQMQAVLALSRQLLDDYERALGRG